MKYLFAFLPFLILIGGCDRLNEGHQIELKYYSMVDRNQKDPKMRFKNEITFDESDFTCFNLDSLTFNLNEKGVLKNRKLQDSKFTLSPYIALYYKNQFYFNVCVFIKSSSRIFNVHSPRIDIPYNQTGIANENGVIKIQFNNETPYEYYYILDNLKYDYEK